jgi:magnesium chelatase family protein
VDCLCPPQAVHRYLSRLSGPLLDRIDLQVEMSSLDFREWAGPARGPGTESSAQVRRRVSAARSVQAGRFGGGRRLNARVSQRELKEHCALDEQGMRMAEAASERMQMSARSLDRVLKVARTIADLSGRARIGAEHVSEALRYRRLDRLADHK